MRYIKKPFRRNERQQAEYDRCFRQGFAARRAGIDIEQCPYLNGGSARETDEGMMVQTVPYMRDGWICGWGAAE